MRSIVIWALLVFTPLNIYGGEGRSGAAFLKIGVGARAMGMGGAFTSISDDPSSVYWNPAGLAQIKKRKILAIHTRLFEGILYEYLAYVHPLRGSSIGLGIGYLHISGLERRGTGDELLGYFDARDMGLIIAFASRMKDLLIGASLKGIHQEIDLQGGDGYGIDGGVIYKGISQDLSIGASIKNMGCLQFGKRMYPLPLCISFGVSHRFLKDRLIIGVDICLWRDTPQARSNFGMEYRLPGFSLRCGYRSGYEERGLARVTIGVGFHRRRGILLDYDYAWVGYGSLGDGHRFSIGLGF